MNKPQVTHAFPLPTASTGTDGQAVPEDMDGQDYQMEMMKMLREVRCHSKEPFVKKDVPSSSYAE